MPEPKPLPPPPNLPDQLSDADEMERVLAEHLSASNEPTPEPIDTDLSSEGGAPLPAPEESTSVDEPTFAERLAKVSSNEDARELIESEVRRFLPVFEAKKFTIENSADMVDYFFEAYNKLLNAEVKGFLERWFESYPNGQIIIDLILELQKIPLLVPAERSTARAKKVAKIFGILSTAVVQAEQGLATDGARTTDIQSQAELVDVTNLSEVNDWRELPDDVIERYQARLATELREYNDRRNIVMPFILGRAAMAAMAIKVCQKVPGVNVASAGYLTKAARRSFDWAIDERPNKPPVNPFAPVIDIAKEGGMYLGVFEDPAQPLPSKLVLLIPPAKKEPVVKKADLY